MISKKLYSENKVPPLTGFPLREGMENFDKPIERTDKSNTANIIDLIKSIRSDKDGNQYQVPLFKYPKGSKLVIYRGPYLDEIIDAFEANKDAGGTPDFEKFKKDLFNRNWYKFKIDPRDFFDISVGKDGPVDFAKGLEEMDNLPYEELKYDERVLRDIKDQTGIGISGLYAEEVSDRLKEDPKAFTSQFAGIARARVGADA